jgi:hypothetical protein
LALILLTLRAGVKGGHKKIEMHNP